MKSRRPPVTGAIQLKNGFYIEIYEDGVKRGMKIRSENQRDMEQIASRYAGDKKVVILGEYKDGLPLAATPVL
jgi:hypothetical protein